MERIYQYLPRELVTFLLDGAALRGKVGDRRKISMGVSAAVLALSVVVALDGLGSNGLWIPLKEQLSYVKDGVIQYVPFTQTWLDFLDCLSEGLMMPLGALLMSFMVSWELKPELVLEEVGQPLAGRWMRRMYRVCIRVIVPVVMTLVLLGQISTFFGLGWF